MSDDIGRKMEGMSEMKKGDMRGEIRSNLSDLFDEGWG